MGRKGDGHTAKECGASVWRRHHLALGACEPGDGHFQQDPSTVSSVRRGVSDQCPSQREDAAYNQAFSRQARPVWPSGAASLCSIPCWQAPLGLVPRSRTRVRNVGVCSPDRPRQTALKIQRASIVKSSKSCRVKHIVKHIVNAFGCPIPVSV